MFLELKGFALVDSGASGADIAGDEPSEGDRDGAEMRRKRREDAAEEGMDEGEVDDRLDGEVRLVEIV